MGLRINLPTADLLGISGVLIFRIDDTTVPATLDAGNIYILEGTVDYTVTLPTTVGDGEEIILKKTGTAPTVTVASTLIEGITQTIEITNNQPVRLVYVSATYGWLVL